MIKAVMMLLDQCDKLPENEGHLMLARLALKASNIRNIPEGVAHDLQQLGKLDAITKANDVGVGDLKHFIEFFGNKKSSALINSIRKKRSRTIESAIALAASSLEHKEKLNLRSMMHAELQDTSGSMAAVVINMENWKDYVGQAKQYLMRLQNFGQCEDHSEDADHGIVVIKDNMVTVASNNWAYALLQVHRHAKCQSLRMKLLFV